MEDGGLDLRNTVGVTVWLENMTFEFESLKLTTIGFQFSYFQRKCPYKILIVLLLMKNLFSIRHILFYKPDTDWLGIQ